MKARHNCRKHFWRGRLEMPLELRKSGKTSTMMQLAKKGVHVFSWIYSGKNAYALFGQPNKRARQISTTKKSHVASVKRAIQKMWKIQKCRTGHGDNGALLPWSAGCKFPTATLEECMVFPKSSKKQSYRAYGTSTHGLISWENRTSTGHRHPKA